MSSRVKPFLPALFVALLLVSSLPFYETMLRNLIRVEFFNLLMAPEVSAMERQSALARVSKLAEWLPHEGSEGISPAGACGMIPALLQAQYYYRLQDWPKFLDWIAVARDSAATPAQQKGLLVPAAATILPDATVMLPFDQETWRLRTNNPQANVEIASPEEVQVSIPDQKAARDVLVYTWLGDVNVIYAPSLHLDVWLKRGAYLTIETVTDRNERRRPVNYYQGEDEWVAFDLPLDANSLNRIDLSLGEPTRIGTEAATEGMTKENRGDEYKAIIRAPMMRISTELGTCHVVAWN